MPGTRRKLRALAVALAAGLVVRQVPAMAGGEGTGSAITVDGAAGGQFAAVTGDGRKLREDEGNRFLHGFLLERVLLRGLLGDGTVLDVGLGIFVPYIPKWTDGSLFARLRRPALWSLEIDVARAISHYDDSLGTSESTSGRYPSLGLGYDVVKSRLDLGLGITLTPSTASRIGVRLDYLGVSGWEVPLLGSRYDLPGGPVFEYPSLAKHGDHRGAVLLDAAWQKGGLGLSVAGGYRFVVVGGEIESWRPPLFEVADTYGKGRSTHALFGRLGLSLALADLITLEGGYRISWTSTRPEASSDGVQSVLGVDRRIEYGPAAESYVLSHTLPLGLLLSPVRGLGIRLHLVGTYAQGKGRRLAEEYEAGTGALLASSGLRSGLESMGLSEALEISLTRLRWLDLRLRQRFELESRDFFRVLFDALDDGWDETRAEDASLTTIRSRVEALGRIRIVKGLVLEARASFDASQQDGVVERLIDWVSYGDSRAWMVNASLGLKYSAGPKISLWTSGRFFHGLRWRPEVTDAGTGYVYDVTGWVATAGIRTAPLPWLSAHAAYSYTHGDYEVASEPLLGAWGPILYEGRIHALSAGFSLAPVDRFAFDAFYELALVQGSLDNVLHRVNAEARVRLWKTIHLGVGYLGRIYDDERFPDDVYGGHAVRALVSGTF